MAAAVAAAAAAAAAMALAVAKEALVNRPSESLALAAAGVRAWRAPVLLAPALADPTLALLPGIDGPLSLPPLTATGTVLFVARLLKGNGNGDAMFPSCFTTPAASTLGIG